MDLKHNWLVASIFFLAGSILYAAMGVVRGLLYAASIGRPSWGYPDPIIEKMVPTYLHSLALVAFLLSAAMIVFPLVLKAFGTRSETPTKQ